MKGAGQPLPTEIVGLISEARRVAPTPTRALQERVLARVQTTVAGEPGGSESTGEGSPSSGTQTQWGLATKGGLVLLLAIGAATLFYLSRDASSGTAATPDRRKMDSPEDRVVAPTKPATPMTIASEAASAPSQSNEFQEANVIESDTGSKIRQRAKRSKPIDSLALEEALLEKARQELSVNPEAALVLLDRHAKDFPKGQLVQERELLRAQANRRIQEPSRSPSSGEREALRTDR